MKFNWRSFSKKLKKVAIKAFWKGVEKAIVEMIVASIKLIFDF